MRVANSATKAATSMQKVPALRYWNHMLSSRFM